MKFAAQIIGSIAISIWVISIQNKKRSNILKFQAIANLLYTIEYFLFGAYPASSMNLISTIRCLIFSKIEEEKTKKWNIFFIILILILGILTYKNLLSITPIIITIFYTISSSKNNTNLNRITVLISAFIWIYYNYKVGAYITILGNILEIISSSFSIIRFKNNNHKD